MPALYRQIYEQLRADIEQGKVAVGQRLPTEAELAGQNDVSTITVKRALDLLREDGLIVRRPRLGTFVITDQVVDAAGPAAPARPSIGAVLTNFDDTFGTQMLLGMLESTDGRADLSVHRSFGDPDTEDRLIRDLVARGAQGIILEPGSSEYVAPAILELITRRFPLTIVDRLLDRVPVSTVCSDNMAGARQLTEHLFDRGHERIGFVSPPGPISSLAERRSGYILAHATRSVPHDESTEFAEVRSTRPSSTTSMETDIDALRAYLRHHSELTAFVACEYNIALMITEACRREGLSVPDDRSVVCFDHPDLSFDLAAFRYTHMQQQQAQLGAQALRQTLAQLDEPAGIGKHVLPMTLVEGVSTKRRRRSSRR